MVEAELQTRAQHRRKSKSATTPRDVANECAENLDVAINASGSRMMFSVP